MTTPSTLYGDLLITTRQDSTGGNLTVSGDLTVNGIVTGTLDKASVSKYGVIRLGDGLIISGGNTVWQSRYSYPGGSVINGRGSYFCVDSNTLEIDSSGTEAKVKVRLKTNGGILSDSYGVYIDTVSTKSLLSLGTVSTLDYANNTGNGSDSGKVPVLNSQGKLANAVIPKLAINNIFTVRSDDAMTELSTAEQGDFCIRPDIYRTFVLNGEASNLSDWIELPVPTDVVEIAKTYILEVVSETYATKSELSDMKDSIEENTESTYLMISTYNEGLVNIGRTYALIGHGHTVTPTEEVPVSGIISLTKNNAHFSKTITGNTVIGFDATGLNLGNNEIPTFELLITNGNRVYNVQFGSTVTWLNGNEPYFNETNTSYLCAFRSYDGGNSWIGAYQGQF